MNKFEHIGLNKFLSDSLLKKINPDSSLRNFIINFRDIKFTRDLYIKFVSENKKDLINIISNKKIEVVHRSLFTALDKKNRFTAFIDLSYKENNSDLTSFSRIWFPSKQFLEDLLDNFSDETSDFY